MASKYPSYDDTYSDGDVLRLCERDQQKSGSCRQMSSCRDLHMCRDYLLERKCVKLESEGACTHSHSLFTLQNQKFVERRARLSLEDGDVYEKIAKLIRKSETDSSKKSFSAYSPSSFSGDPGQTSIMTTGHGSPTFSTKKTTPLKASYSLGSPLTPSATQSSKPASSSRFFSFGDGSLLQTLKDYPSDLMKKITAHSGASHSSDQDPLKTKEKMLASKSSCPSSKAESEKNPRMADRSPSWDDESSTIKHTTMSSGGHTHRITEECNGFAESGTQLVYLFDEYSEQIQLSYLHGPVRQNLIEVEGYQVLSSGYYRWTSDREEKDIKIRIRQLLKARLEVSPIHPLDDELAFYSSTSAAERLFEQNQREYAIMSKPCDVSFTIEIIDDTSSGHRRRSHSSGKTLSPQRSLASNPLHTSPSDDKYHIPATDSSIDVIIGDISRIPVDLIVCVTTSKTILGSVLHRAGSSIEARYNRYREDEFLVLPGGTTSAKNILFAPWLLEVRAGGQKKALKSLSLYVRSCISEARRLNLTSISFPSIGTGELGLDVRDVCQAMFQSAIDCLQQYQMDVHFVIYPSKESTSSQRPEIVFRNYLIKLCEQSLGTSGATSSRSQLAKSVSVRAERREDISRTTNGKSLSTVSTLPNMTPHHKTIKEALKELITEEVFDLSLVQRQFQSQIDLLVDVCLKYNVLPRIDLSKSELSLRGDIHSCLQCFANLQNSNDICEYDKNPQTSGQLDKTKLNIFMSLKLDEARVTGKTEILIEDDRNTRIRIDINNLKMYVSSHGPPVKLSPVLLNANSRINPPNSWSSSMLRIRTKTMSSSEFQELEFLSIFHQTMPRSEWRIERIDSIENWPLYVHFVQERSKIKTAAFHACSFSSVQSIIHYGLHAISGDRFRQSIQITRDAIDTHITNSRRSTDGRYYMFAVQLNKKFLDLDRINLSHEDADRALPTHLIVYQRIRDFQ